MLLQIIVGSTRPTRAADRVTPWVAAAAANSVMDLEVLDLAGWPLPFFSEHLGTIGDIADPTYSDPLVRSWNKTVARADAFLIITPEYNHGVPAALKNALDTVWLSGAFRNKPIGFVGYSAGVGGGIRAIEHLVQIAVEQEAAPLRGAVVIPYVHDAFDDMGIASSVVARATLQVLLDDLAWWATALARARNAGELEPSRARVRATTTASEAVV